MTERNKRLKNFCNRIAYNFKNNNLLEEAITHPSFAKQNCTKFNYQRLEFLGDKVLSLVIGEFLLKQFPLEKEGDLSKRQAALVSGNMLAKISIEITIDKILKMGKGESNLGGKTNKRNLENAMEALIGAIYLDSDYECAKNFIIKLWKPYLKKDATPPQDPVSGLQEIVQSQSRQLPQYSIVKTGGLDHEPHFEATVQIKHLGIEFRASGKSKKESQHKVAQIAIGYLNNPDNHKPHS